MLLKLHSVNNIIRILQWQIQVILTVEKKIVPTAIVLNTALVPQLDLIVLNITIAVTLLNLSVYTIVYILILYTSVYTNQGWTVFERPVLKIFKYIFVFYMSYLNFFESILYFAFKYFF